MNSCPIYYRPLNPKKSSTRQDEKWDEAVAFFNSKQYDKVIPTLLEYVGNHFECKKMGDTYEIPHGSVVIAITQTADELLVKCPFLHIKNAKKVPLMRRLAELRMYPLNLANVVLEDNLVYFTFACPISLCEPYKIYGVFREICYHADSFDDEFIEKFGAAHLQEPKTTPFSENVKQEAYANCQKNFGRRHTTFGPLHGKAPWKQCLATLNTTLKNRVPYRAPRVFTHGFGESNRWFIR
ncbi:MAG: hypothetical protein R2814_11455 [Flavobacteriaceae bacterium]